MAEVTAVVHTHTHTQCNLKNDKKGMKYALLKIYARDE